MRNVGKLAIVGVVGLLIFALPVSAEEIDGQWHAMFDTPAGVQTYHFDFQDMDGKLTAKAVVESADEMRDVEFEEAKLDGETLKFVELRKFGERELRIEYTGKLSDRGIMFTRKIGDFGSQESGATRDIPKPEPQSSAPVVKVHLDRIIKDAYKDLFRVGTAGDFPSRYSSEELQLASEHFNAVTPENCMKPERVHPDEKTWRFELPDALVQWATDSKMSVHGHTLVWHAQTGDWFFRDGDREVLTQRMKDHIHTLVGRYRGEIQSWDVVNEAINDAGNEETGQTENLRDSKWLQTLGPKFLTLAFKFAHEADPDAILYYNDYNIESGPKHDSSMVLLKRLLDDGAPIHAVGIQGHWTTGRVPYEDIDKAISDYASLGLKVSITELDVTIRGASGGQFGGGFGRRRFGSREPASIEDLNAQADAYAKLFAIFSKHKDVIERVTFWGLNDRRTWRFGQHPLIFDANNYPKPAYAAIVNEPGRD
ncbi:endo-1,4-beta-xylanase [Rubripirellula reticaptiva]|uniref:Beta-xylanase n=1 Tax=Rubripirellula reticaptiva TaxID=2528013 RepID=A0A5C6FFJ1_9BACT|nr:endo-1,4-beta-xylanase [Rubripirellula reticaptiva]TWU58399.1 Endo-1,4-beta-xylanase [Rubripirellula reticaptiva]